MTTSYLLPNWEIRPCDCRSIARPRVLVQCNYGQACNYTRPCPSVPRRPDVACPYRTHWHRPLPIPQETIPCIAANTMDPGDQGAKPPVAIYPWRMTPHPVTILNDMLLP
jgi:hypothetical protein